MARKMTRLRTGKANATLHVVLHLLRRQVVATGDDGVQRLTFSAVVVRVLLVTGRSVLFSGVTVAVSLAALIALPVPFLRSVGFTGLLIPIISVIAALTLLPALLLSVGPRLAWPHRRPGSRVCASAQERR